MTPITAERLSKIAKYIKAERLHVDAKEQWTLPRHRNIGMGWQRSPLASIVINATPEVTVPGGVRVPAFGTSRVSLVRALEIRATYRLCGTLLMIGEGARKDALDIIDDTRCMYLWHPILPFCVTFLSLEAPFGAFTQGICLRVQFTLLNN